MKTVRTPGAWVVVAMTTVHWAVVGHAWATGSGPVPVRYELQAGSAYEQGCYEPCRCALTQAPISGTFSLTLDHVDPLFTHYTVSSIDWRGEDATLLRVTGSGTYRIGGEVAITHQLVLDLSINGEPVEHFDSGSIVVGGEFPDINIVVSQNQMVCYDTVFRIVAKPLPPTGGVPYRLTDKSTYQQGCFDLCDCAIWEQVPMTGTFRLVSESFAGFFHHYKVVDVKFTAKLLDHEIVLTGSGRYRIGEEFGVRQQMQLDLSLNGGEVMHLDSGLISGDADFPAIDIPIATDTHCFDIRLQLSARPVRGVPYRLTEKSTFQQGCFVGCACPISPEAPMRGTFHLVPEDFDSLFRHFAVRNVKWSARLGDHEVQIAGSGQYRVGGEFAAMHRLELDLSVDGGESQHFDSGLIVGGALFPAIDVAVSTNTGCFDVRLEIRARPAGDFDLDGDVDQADAEHFETCASGPNVTMASAECAACDLDGDGDVDQADHGIFQRCLSGPDVPADPGCGE